MAQPTMQSVLDQARITLNDADKDRHSDADLLKFANRALDEAYRLRPDLFIGQFSSLTEGHQLAVGADFPIDGRFRSPVVDLVIGWAEMTDDEHSVSGRAAALLTKFEKGLIG